MKLDEVDKSILQKLVGNGRVTYSELAEEVGLSSSGVKRRVDLLEEEGVIKDYTARLDPKKAGYGVTAFLNIDVRSGEAGRVAGALTRCKGVCEVHRTTGNHGLMVKVRAEDRNEISEFVEERVGNYQGVRDVNITMTMKTYKEDSLSI